MASVLGLLQVEGGSVLGSGDSRGPPASDNCPLQKVGLAYKHFL